MKHSKSILSIAATFLLILTGCNKKAPEIILPANGENNFVSEPEPGKTYLNLTSIGLYEGSKGTAIADTNLEYGKVLVGLEVGDNLPKDEITSTTANVVFYKWCYYQDGGVLSYTDKVVKNIDLYQAAFTYNGNYKPTPSTIATNTSTPSTPSTGTDVDPTTPSISVPDPTLPTPTTSVPPPPPTTDPSTSTTPTPTVPDTSTPITTPVVPDTSTPITTPVVPDTSSTVPVEPTKIVEFHFYDKAWWNEGGAESWVYVFDSKGVNELPATWPGVQMKHVEWIEALKQNLWTFEVDLNKYDTVVISRQKTIDDTVTSWGSQTDNVKLDQENYIITLGDVPAWDGNKAGVSLSKPL